MSVRSWHLLLSSSLLASGLGAQSYPLDKCAIPREPLGMLHGGGEVRYQLGKNGKPDTASLAVLSADRISVSGLRSAAARLLSACKMAKPRGEAVAVTQGIRFDGTRLVLDPAVPADGAKDALTDSPPSLLPGTTYSDTLVEEAPRLIRCARPPVPSGPQERTFSSRSEAETALAMEARRNSGRVLMRLVVDTTGRVLADSITVISSDNPGLTNNIRSSFASCRFTPARIGGVPVRSAVRSGSGIQISSEVEFN